MPISDVLTIDGKEISAGQNSLVKLMVSQLPSGTPIDINVHVFRSKRPGPVVMLLGGMHGDEINGVEIVRRALRSPSLRKLKKGTVIAVPILNVFGFNNFSRALPDGKDVNRSFPGTASGSLASRVAHTMSKKIMPLIDIGLDFHTGGSTIFNYPQVRYTQGDARSKKLADEFNAPFLLANKTISKSLRGHAKDVGKSIIVYEGGESLRIDEWSIEVGLRGIANVLASEGMIDTPEDQEKEPSILFTNSRWLRAPRAGIFTLSARAGDRVEKGELLGEINRMEARKPVSVVAPFDCHVLSNVNNPVVSRGDALFHLVY